MYNILHLIVVSEYSHFEFPPMPEVCSLVRHTSPKPCVFNKTFGCSVFPDSYAPYVWVTDKCRGDFRCDDNSVVSCGTWKQRASRCLCGQQSASTTIAVNDALKALPAPRPATPEVCSLVKHTSPKPCIFNRTFGCSVFPDSHAPYVWVTDKCRGDFRCDDNSVISCGTWKQRASQCLCGQQSASTTIAVNDALKTLSAPRPATPEVCSLVKHKSPKPCIFNRTFGCSVFPDSHAPYVWVTDKCRGDFRCDDNSVISCGTWKQRASRCLCGQQSALTTIAVNDARKALPALRPATPEVCSLVKQKSSKCVFNKSFGCARFPDSHALYVWVTDNCRGDFRCDESSVITCGVWRKKSSRCLCRKRNETATTMLNVALKSLPAASKPAPDVCSLVQHTSKHPCIPKKTFGYNYSSSSRFRYVWVKDKCQGLFQSGVSDLLECGRDCRDTGEVCYCNINKAHGPDRSNMAPSPLPVFAPIVSAGTGMSTRRPCHVVHQTNFLVNCTINVHFACLPSTRGRALTDVVVTGGCRGSFRCGGLALITCESPDAGSVSRCLCPPWENVAKRAQMTSHGNFSQQLRRVFAEDGKMFAQSRTKSRLDRRLDRATTGANDRHQSSEPVVPASPRGCEGRLLHSPLLSTEHSRVLRSYYQQGLFRRRLRNASALVEHARASSAPLATRRYRSCAVVGSSSKLLDRTDGAKIDSAELVFRLNNAPTPPQLHKHVGSRTDVYFDAFSLRHNDSEWCPSNRISNTGECLGARTDQQIFICWGVMYPDCLLHRAPSGAVGQWDRTSPGLELYARSLVYGPDAPACNGGCRRTPSSGIIAILLALHRCDQTYLYGFGSSPRQPCAKYYYKQGSPDCRQAKYFRDSYHNMPLEHAWLRFITNNFRRNMLTCHVLPRSK